MARQPDIQYIRYYTSGSAARKIELQPEKKKKNTVAVPQRPRTRKQNKMVIHLDPISMLAVMVAGIMLITMVIGMLRLGQVNAEVDAMNGYVEQLQQENSALRQEYESGYDLEDVEQKALEMGLVPIEQVEHVTIEVPETPVEAEPTFWEKAAAFFSELFA
jgi:cell division protein FtsL